MGGYFLNKLRKYPSFGEGDMLYVLITMFLYVTIYLAIIVEYGVQGPPLPVLSMTGASWYVVTLTLYLKTGDY